MKRCMLSVLCFLFCGLAGCDRETVASAILMVGFNVRTEGTFDGEPVTADAPADPRESHLAQAAENLLELRKISSDHRRAALELEQGIELAERVIEAVDLYTGSPQRDDLKAEVMFEAKWSALQQGMDLSPGIFRDRHENFREQYSQSTTRLADLQRESVNRFVTDFLSSPTAEADIASLLRLHVACYPESRMNPELFVTTSDQLVSHEMISEAVALAEEGLHWSDDRRDLTAQLQRIYREFPTAIGVPMNFAGPDLTGQRREIQSLRGSPVLVVFWASWCPGCCQESVHIQRVADRFADEGLEVVGVSLDRSRSELASLVAKQGLTWTQVFTENPEHAGWDNPIAKYYGIESIPYAFLLDRQGKIRAAGLRGEAQLSEAISRVLHDDA